MMPTKALLLAFINIMFYLVHCFLLDKFTSTGCGFWGVGVDYSMNEMLTGLLE